MGVSSRGNVTVKYRTRSKCNPPHPLAVLFLVVGLILLASEYFRRGEAPIMKSCPIGFKADELMKARDRWTDLAGLIVNGFETKVVILKIRIINFWRKLLPRY